LEGHFLYPRQRYQCIQCGKSCGGWQIWVEPEEVHRLELQAHVQADHGHLRLLQDERGSCHFLTENKLCQLHQQKGPQHKPRACRQFPFFLNQTPDGVQVGVSFRCTAVQQDRGVDWLEHQAVLEEWAALGLPRLGFEPAPIDNFLLDWATYKRWEHDWLQDLAQGRTLQDSVESALLQALPRLEAGGLRRLIPILSASAVGFLEGQSAEEAAEIAAAIRQGVPYQGHRAGLVSGLSHPFQLHPDVDRNRYLSHALERKSLWMGHNFLGRLMMLLCAECLVAYFQKLDSESSSAKAIERVEGEWLTHRQGLEVLETQFARTLLQLC